MGVAGENIAYRPITAQEAVQQFLTSPVHCENLMDPHWTQFGGAVNNGTADTLFPTYWVQVFGMEGRWASVQEVYRSPAADKEESGPKAALIS